MVIKGIYLKAGTAGTQHTPLSLLCYVTVYTSLHFSASQFPITPSNIHVRIESVITW